MPFPVHVVERVETFDHLSCNRFVTRYAYHHGHFDRVEGFLPRLVRGEEVAQIPRVLGVDLATFGNRTLGHVLRGDRSKPSQITNCVLSG